jgi:hypothetical protein
MQRGELASAWYVARINSPSLSQAALEHDHFETYYPCRAIVRLEKKSRPSG